MRKKQGGESSPPRTEGAETPSSLNLLKAGSEPERAQVPPFDVRGGVFANGVPPSLVRTATFLGRPTERRNRDLFGTTPKRHLPERLLVSIS